MNILIPDSWLRTFLKTKATPIQIKEYLSLCGPSVERIYEDSGEPVYDVEITTNRPDAMSVFGVAREAAVILPRFGIAAELLNNPYTMKPPTAKGNKKLTIITDPILNPRWASVVLSSVNIKPSPSWLSDWLTKTGIRPINTVVDVTNYLMRAYGQPAHAFDYDSIEKHSMKLRASKKGENITTLDGKAHTLSGDDIVIADGSGKLIDLCGIMGGENSSITNATTTVVLFIQTYEPTHIRKTSMKLAHRTEAAGLFEKGVDSELVLPALIKGVQLLKEIAGAKIDSAIEDINPSQYKTYQVSVSRNKLDSYIGTNLPDKELISILSPLGFSPTLTKNTIIVHIPSWRRDVAIDVDIIEEIARIYGYHKIENKLPEGELPMIEPDKTLLWEEELKIRLRDWGYTELYSYSMISEEQIKNLRLKAYKITNPLSEEWIYMRPSLEPSFLAAIKENLKHKNDFQVFELSKIYRYSENSLPQEEDALIVGLTGNRFFEAKGVAEAILDLFGITSELDKYGSLKIIDEITVLELSIQKLTQDAKPVKKFVPIPKYPPIVEDLTFIVPDRFEIGPLLIAFQTVHPLVVSVTFLDIYENTRTVHITYQSPDKNLTNDDITPIRQSLIQLAKSDFGAILKSA